MRVIIAVEPAIPVVERLILLQEDLADPMHLLGAETRWVPAEDIRLVLYTGEIEEGALAFARIALREGMAALRPFEFATFGSRFVPDEHSPRIVAVGSGAGTDELVELRAVALAALHPLGIALDDDPGDWKPMIALGRLQTSATTPPLTGVLRPYSETAYGTTRASEVVLSTTELSGGRMRARLVDRLPLAGGKESAA